MPPIYLVENEDDFKQLPKGIPYVIGTQKELKFITIFLEFQILFKSAKRTGLPLNWLNVLARVGYAPKNIKHFELNSGGNYWESSEGNRVVTIDDFIEEQYLVNFDKLAELKIFPKWLDDIKASIEVNVIDEVQFDPTAFNKQLGLNIGYRNIKRNMKNLLILDVSGSIPKSIVIAITNMAKLMSKKFYADIIITSGKSQLIDYDDVPNSDIIEIARISGGGNEGKMFTDILNQEKEYNTVICFGDDDNPDYYMRGESGKKCNFKVTHLYSLHTKSTSNNLTGYCRWLTPKNEPILVRDWVNTLN